MQNSTFCTCGRFADKLHCPFCGCHTVNAQARLRRVVDGVDVMSYRCRKCGRLFDDLMRQLCDAPASGVTGQGTSIGAQATEKALALPTEEQQKIIDYVKRKRDERLSEQKAPNSSDPREDL